MGASSTFLLRVDPNQEARGIQKLKFEIFEIQIGTNDVIRQTVGFQRIRDIPRYVFY